MYECSDIGCRCDDILADYTLRIRYATSHIDLQIIRMSAGLHRGPGGDSGTGSFSNGVSDYVDIVCGYLRFQAETMSAQWVVTLNSLT